jgi:hypothetical protein
MKPAIDPDAPIAEQIKQLQALINGPAKFACWIVFTPALARWTLNNLCEGNRSMKPVRIRRYAKDMTARAFLPNGESVKFGAGGMLRDGQNRLAACVKAGVRFESLVVFGIREPNHRRRQTQIRRRRPTHHRAPYSDQARLRCSLASNLPGAKA